MEFIDKLKKPMLKCKLELKRLLEIHEMNED